MVAQFGLHSEAERISRRRVHRCAQSSLAVALSARVSHWPLRLAAHAVASAPDSAAAAFGRPIPGILRGEV